MIHVYGIKNCDSVKKTVTFLKNNNLEYIFHDFKTDPVNENIIKKWVSIIPMETLLNTKGTTYRTLGLKSMNLSDQKKIEWMAKENLLIKRPVIVSGDNIIVGFNQSQYEGFFGS